MRRRLVLLVLTVVLLGVAGWGVRAVWDRWQRTTFQHALSMVDTQALRVSFTDWRQIRAEVDASASESPEDWIERAYERDLIAVSSIDDSAAAMVEHFGFSPVNASWETFSQGREGAAMVLGFEDTDEADFDSFADHLAEAGYEKPEQPDGVWKGGVDLVAALDPTLTPEVQYVALLADQGVVVTSDTREHAASVSEVVRGKARSLSSTDADDLVGVVGEPDAAVLWTGDFACEDLSMASAAPEDQALAERLIAEAGEITPVTGVVIALDDQRLVVAEQFADDDQAESNLRARAKLAVGPAVGRGEGRFDDELELVSARTKGRVMMLDFTARSTGSYPLSRHTDGALVFASC